MTAILIVEDDVLANEHLEFIFNRPVTRCCLRRAPTRRRSYLKYMKTFNF